MNVTYLTAGPEASADGVQRGVDVFILGASTRQVGVVMAVVTFVGLFKDEIDEFFWWPLELHLSGWLLTPGTVALGGAARLRSQGFDVAVGPGGFRWPSPRSSCWC